MVRDMTTGSPTKLILYFSLPLLIGNIFQQPYNMADAVVVGHFADAALATMGSIGAISFLVLGFVLGLTGVFSVVMARRFGAENRDGLRQSVAMLFYIGGMMVLLTHPCVLWIRLRIIYKELTSISLLSLSVLEPRFLQFTFRHPAGTR